MLNLPRMSVTVTGSVAAQGLPSLSVWQRSHPQIDGPMREAAVAEVVAMAAAAGILFSDDVPVGPWLSWRHAHVL